MLLCWQYGYAAMDFTDVTVAAGIGDNHDITSSDFTYTSGANTISNEEWSWMTGGSVAEDFDGDGWVDLYVVRTNPQKNLLYMNNGDGTFTEEAAARGADLSGIFFATAAADYDSDGDVDILVTGLQAPHILLINDGAGSFTSNNLMINTPAFGGTGPSWADLNNDGYLDLALGSWNVGKMDNLHVYMNDGSGNLTESLFIPNRFIFHPRFFDYNDDHYQDLFMVADFGDLYDGTRYFSNNGTGIFTQDGSSDVQNGMGSAVGDIDNDGDLDVFITSIRDFDTAEANWGTTGNRLLRNDGGGNFTDITTSAGVRDGYWGWGAEMADFDNDGDLDIYQVNGWPEQDHDSPAQFNEKPALMFENIGANTFQEIAAASSSDDTGQGRCVSVFDYDNDGDQDIFIVNNSTLVDLGGGTYDLQAGSLVLLRNDTNNTNHWLDVKLDGDGKFHKHGIGSRVYVNAGGVAQMRELHASSGYNGHGTGRIAHFGLGSETDVDVEARWLNGDKTKLYNVGVDVSMSVDPPKSIVSTRVLELGETIHASLDLSSIPDADSAIWTIDGVDFPNPANTSFLTPGSYELVVNIYNNDDPPTIIRTESLLIKVDDGVTDERSIAQLWNEQNLAAIRIDFPAPTTHSRNLFHTSIAMYDAWCAYGSGSEIAYLHRENQTSVNIDADRREAISYAAYRLLYDRYQSSVNGSTTVASINLLMQQLGYDPSVTTTVGDTPAALGNRIAETVLNYYSNDGAYDMDSFLGEEYATVNDPLNLSNSGNTLNDPNRWQPLLFENALTQNGLPADLVQTIVGPEWGAVRPFALTVASEGEVYYDPGSPPMLGGDGDQQFKDNNVEVIWHSSLLDPNLPATIDISPSSWGNHTLGQNDGTGYAVNPATGLPYDPQIVKHADFGRVLAEFWADGPDSETPPGHWNVLANELHENPDFLMKYKGLGDELDRLEWDVKLYLALNGSLHDSAITAWGCKRVYDYIRPISSIRYMGGLGQSTNPSGPSYNPSGLPLTPNLIEVVTASSSLPGERHEHLAGDIGKVAIYAWSPNETSGQLGGVGWMLAEDWFPYQRATFVTPAFPGYVSGHSTFSRAAAEVLTYFTGTKYFPGGMGTFLAKQNEYLHFEPGPSEDVILQWATYYDAADQAGKSRLYGGIHVAADDGPGRIMGSKCGIGAAEMADKYFDGSILSEPMKINSSEIVGNQIQFSWEALRGFYYKVEFSEDLGPFAEVGDWIQAEDVYEYGAIDTTGRDNGFVRVRRSPTIPSP